ncbi:hypothetical protein [Aquirhabdus parva]|uniref:Uncharacterized protein n=1 Tax=Aquirhabdus parva TaxID=2283318 RepID=A0A345P9M8_9GAMM|nr:hypothetical protein [Aquirhabdus parva]AXI03987.1 hypothetical protein HYN46_14740 [Aquirhabdus parva]
MTSTLVSTETFTDRLQRGDVKNATLDEIFHYVYLFFRHVLMSLMMLGTFLWLMVTVVAIADL